MYCPPLALMVESVIRPASSDAMNTTQRAFSSGSPKRPIGSAAGCSSPARPSAPPAPFLSPVPDLRWCGRISLSVRTIIVVVIHIPILCRVLLKIGTVRRDLCHVHDSSLQGAGALFIRPFVARVCCYRPSSFGRSSSGSLAKFTANRCASSRVSRFGRRAMRRSDMSGIGGEGEVRGLRSKRR
jgi:hypothetical protein